MDKSSQETTATETKQLTLMDDDISQADYERLREGKKVEVEVKSETVAQDAIVETEDDESDPSQTDGDDDEADSDESELAAKDKGAQKKPKRGFKRRIDKLNSKLSAAEQEREYWKQEALKHSTPKQERADVELPASPDLNAKPKADDFETHEEFVEALTDWKVEQKERDREAKVQKTQIKTEYEQRVQAHTTRVKEFAKGHDDFMDLMSDVDDVPMSITVQEVILASDNGPELMYELAKDREEFERICKLPAIEAARALGRLEARLAKPSEETKPQKPKTTKAPPPTKPISTSSASGKKSIWDENISQAEYERMRAEQEKRRASNY